MRVGASNLLGRGRVGCRHRRYTAECQGLGYAPNGKTGTNNGAATNTASTTLAITLPDGLSADNRTRLCWQTAGWLVTHARQYGIDALHADGMDWNRKAGTWTGTETAEQTITFTLA